MVQNWDPETVRLTGQTTATSLAQQRVPASALASVPYSDLLSLAPGTERDSDPETGQSTAQTRALCSAQRKEPASALGSVTYSEPP